MPSATKTTQSAKIWTSCTSWYIMVLSSSVYSHFLYSIKVCPTFYHLLNFQSKPFIYLFLALNMSEEPGDRYYNAVYSLILRPELLVETKRYPMLLNLIYRTVSSDVNMSRQKSFIKRLLMVAMMSKTPFQAAVLVLIGKSYHFLNFLSRW